MTAQFIHRPEGRIAYEVHGSGRNILCIPGLGDTRSSYDRLVPLLTSAGCRVYSMDLRGHGDSDASFSRWSASAIATDIVALMDTLDLDKVTLVGCSIGGGAACAASVARPERVHSLVLLNPFVRDMPADRWLRPLVPWLFADLWGAWAWGRYRRTLFASDPDPRHEAEVSIDLRKPGHLAAMRAMIRSSKADIEPQLCEVTAPVTVLMGAEDPDFSDPSEEGRELCKRMGGHTRLDVLPRCGHYPQWEQSAETARQVLAHGTRLAVQRQEEYTSSSKT